MTAERQRNRDQALRERMAAAGSPEHRTRVALDYLKSAMIYARKHRALSDEELAALADEVIGYLLERAGVVESATADASPVNALHMAIRRGAPSDAGTHAREGSVHRPEPAQRETA